MQKQTVDAEKALVSDTSFFELFQIEPSMDLNLPSLEATYHRLSLQLHPDCNLSADLKTRLQLLDKTTQLNEAYATLLNPQRRAVYLLKMCGIDLEDKQKAFQASPLFLNHLLELKEQLQQALATRQTDKLESLEKLAKEALQKEFECACQCLQSHLKQKENTATPNAGANISGGENTTTLGLSPLPFPHEKLKQAAAHLVCVRYWQRFMADIEHLLEELSL